MDDNRYVRAIDSIHPGGGFQEETACKMRQVLAGLSSQPQPISPIKRHWIAPTVTAALLVCLCVAGMLLGPKLSFFDSSSQSLAEEHVPYTAELPSLVWEGRVYSTSLHSQFESEDPVQTEEVPIATALMDGESCPIYSVEGFPPQIVVAAERNGSGRSSSGRSDSGRNVFSFKGFVSEDHSMADILSLYEEACGSPRFISCNRRDSSMPDEPGETLVQTSDPEEMELLLSYFADMRPDSSLLINQGNTHDNGSTVTHTMDTRGRRLFVRFENGISLSLSLYLNDGAAGGYGNLYPLPQDLADWALGQP